MQRHTEERRRRVLWLILAMTFLALLSLACGMNARAIPACQDAPSGDECSACCSREGFNGHLYNSTDRPPCECM
jgi:hypothetical protein